MTAFSRRGVFAAFAGTVLAAVTGRQALAEPLIVTGAIKAGRIDPNMFLALDAAGPITAHPIHAERIAIGTRGTSIEPGEIVISGQTKLKDWRDGYDTTKIEAGHISANQITSGKMSINDLRWDNGLVRLTDEHGKIIKLHVLPGGGSGG